MNRREPVRTGSGSLLLVLPSLCFAEVTLRRLDDPQVPHSPQMRKNKNPNAVRRTPNPLPVFRTHGAARAGPEWGCRLGALSSLRPASAQGPLGQRGSCSLRAPPEPHTTPHASRREPQLKSHYLLRYTAPSPPYRQGHVRESGRSSVQATPYFHAEPGPRSAPRLTTSPWARPRRPRSRNPAVGGLPAPRRASTVNSPSWRASTVNSPRPPPKSSRSDQKSSAENDVWSLSPVRGVTSTCVSSQIKNNKRQ